MQQAQNLVQIFQSSVEKRGDNACLRYCENDNWLHLSWNNAREKVARVAGGLKKLGIKPQDRVAIFSKTRFEWTLADLGIMAASGIVVPIYESNTGEQAEFILNDSECRAVFVENEAQFKKVVAAKDRLKNVDCVVTFTDFPSRSKYEGVYSFEELLVLGTELAEKTFQESLKNLKPENDATFVYTSGTTGNPKGAILTHGNFLAEIECGRQIFKFEENYESIIFLPLAHILARVCQFFQIAFGFTQAYAESIDKLTDNISVIKPHFMASVPRIFEKIHTRTLQGVQTASTGKKKVFEWAMAVGSECSRLKIAKKPVPFGLNLKFKLAEKLVFSKLKEKLGGRIEFFISGGAPLSVDVAEFFHTCGFIILEGYGLTETTAAITVNRIDDVTIGTVGKPIPCVEMKIADDGEICVRGPVVFRGYYKNPEGTTEVLDKDGWFKTGDIGVFDAEGHLKITDRKKDIIVTAAGKNIAPQNIENMLKADPYISQAVVHGDRRKFLSAIVTVERTEIERYAKSAGLADLSFEKLVKHDKVHELIRNAIEQVNCRLAKYETIKKFEIVPDEFTVEGGEITPTLKVKRKVVNQKYKKIFDSFYCDADSEKDSAA